MTHAKLHHSPLAAIHHVLGKCIKAVHLNSITIRRWRHFPVVVKRRNSFGRHIIPLANLFFRAVGAPSLFWKSTRQWQHWEVTFFRMLNPPFYAARLDRWSIVEQKLPGEDLWTLAKKGSLTSTMVRAAGRELRRAHAFWSAPHQGPWSHGDGAMCNYLYDPRAHRARLIDFELAHDPALSALTRQAEDLLAFLLDLATVTAEDQWLPLALQYLRAYGQSDVIVELQTRLQPPRGLGRIWWLVRTNFASSGKTTARLAALHEAIASSPIRLIAFPAYPRAAI